MKTVVTGGAGFIGANLVAALLQDGHEVHIIDNLSTGKRENLVELVSQPDCTFIDGTVTNLDLLRAVFRDIDCVFHQAAIPSVQRSVEDPRATNEANVNGTLAVLIAARDCGVKKVVYASSSSIYGDTPTLPKTEEMIPNPKSPYAVTKLTGEYYCRVFSEVYGLKTVSLRYFNVYGPKQDPSSDYAAVIPRFITRALEQRPPIIYGDGAQTRDFTFVRDVAHANIQSMKQEVEGVFNIACGERISVNKLARIIMELVGVDLGIIYDEPRSGDIKDSLADISRARKELVYNPEYSLTAGLEETIRWFRTAQT
ncbi:MAG TPA: SDR family oxidoreductase [Methanomicrobia archaeon]|nr:SDR family oxidoreductase [Methanomicrobia archaeon]